MSKTELIIQNGNNIMQVAVEEGITWETVRKGAPGTLTFTVVKDTALGFQEGNQVRFTYDGYKIFYGFVFTKKRSGNDLIEVICYDQLRYFKGKDTYNYKNKTAADVLKMIAADLNLRIGAVEETGYGISRIEDNKTFFDMIQTALDYTLQYTSKLFVLYDDFGQLALRNIQSMKLDVLIDEETGEGFEYTSSIDSNTYNKIKLIYEDKDKATNTNKREVYIVQDMNTMNQWGVLQYFEKLQSNVNAQMKANVLLALYNKKTRNLNIKDAAGDARVRAGSSLAVSLYLGDIYVANYMVVETAKHTFKESEHSMTLRLIGGEFVA